MCGWTNSAEDSGYWELASAASASGAAPSTDHTTGLPTGGLLRLAPADPPPPGHTARLEALPLVRQSSAGPMCLTFRSARAASCGMYTQTPTGPTAIHGKKLHKVDG